MKNSVYILTLLILSAGSLCCKAQSPDAKTKIAEGELQIIKGNFKDFGIENTDTVLTLDCNEFFTDPKTSLFYADFRKSFDMTFDVQINTNLTEQVFKRNGKYYNVYAADAPGVQSEQLAYSMADNITGTWTYGGLVTGPAKFGFTIHPSVNEFNGKWYLFYHDGSYMHDGAPGGDFRRQVCVEPLYFDEEGKILPIELTEIGVTK